MVSCVLLAHTGDWRAAAFIRADLTPSLSLSLVCKPRISSLFCPSVPNCSSHSEKSSLSLHPAALPRKEGKITANLFGGPAVQDAHAACVIFLCWLSSILFILHSHIDRKCRHYMHFTAEELRVGGIKRVSGGHLHPDGRRKHSGNMYCCNIGICIIKIVHNTGLT